MLINRWLSLILLFVVCGCGGWKGKYERLLEVHQKTQRSLKDERAAHGKTQENLENEKTAHGRTQRNLRNEKTAHGRTQENLRNEKTAHGRTQENLRNEKTAHGRTQENLRNEKTAHGRTQENLRNEKTAHGRTQENLRNEKTAHGRTQRNLRNEKDAHGKTQQQLDIEESALKSIRNTLTQSKTENRNLARRYHNLMEIKKPLIRDYFELGRVSLEFGVIKEDAEKIKEAVNLFSQARYALKKAIKGEETSEAHYYLARAYYRLAKRREADFEDACAHAKKAIALAPQGKHEGAEALKKKIANCK